MTAIPAYGYKLSFYGVLKSMSKGGAIHIFIGKIIQKRKFFVDFHAIFRKIYQNVLYKYKMSFMGLSLILLFILKVLYSVSYMALSSIG